MGTPVQWHTEGRRQPSLIGKDPAGKPLWGGPYTTYQGAAIVLALIVTWGTRWLWGAHLPSAEQLVITVGVAAAASYGAGRIDYTQISPIWNTIGWFHTQENQLMRPHGTHPTTGRARRTPKPQGRHTPPTWVLDFTTPILEPSPVPEPAVSVQSAAESAQLERSSGDPIASAAATSDAPTAATSQHPEPPATPNTSSRPRHRPPHSRTRGAQRPRTRIPDPPAPAPESSTTDLSIPETVTPATPRSTGTTPATYTRAPELQPAGRASGLEAFLAAASSNRSPR